MYVSIFRFILKYIRVLFVKGEISDIFLYTNIIYT